MLAWDIPPIPTETGTSAEPREQAYSRFTLASTEEADLTPGPIPDAAITLTLEGIDEADLSPEELARHQRLVAAVQNNGVAFGTVLAISDDQLVIRSFEDGMELTFAIDEETEFFVPSEPSPPSEPIGPVATWTRGDALAAPTATAADFRAGDFIFVLANEESALQVVRFPRP